MTGTYNNFFRIFDRESKTDVALEATRDNMKPRQVLKPRRICGSSGAGGAAAKRKKDEISVDSLDFNKKILHAAYHPSESVIAVVATNNLYIFNGKD
jgi:serine/threonine-protein phosphatase 2A regulatory subunit B